MLKWLDRLASGRIVLITLTTSLSVYLVMVFLTLPHIQQLAGGLKPFDLLPQGYDIAYATSFLEHIKEEGRHFYLTKQIPLDLIYPGMFAFTFAVMWLWLLHKSADISETWAWLALLPILAGIADYIENIFIVTMLYTYPDISNVIVSAASISTIIKSMATTVYFVALLFLILFTGVHKYRSRRAEM